MFGKWFVVAVATIALTYLSANEYDLQEILNLAEENNRQIQLARADLETASAEKLDAFSAALPKIDVTGGYNRNFQESVFFFEATDPMTGELQRGSFKTSFANEFRFNAILRQTIFSFEVGFAIQAARYFDNFVQFNYDFVRQQVLTDVKIAFYRAVLLKEVLQVARESETSAKDNYDNLQLKFEAGVVSEFDLLQAEVRWQNAIPRTIQARQDYVVALNNLKLLTGLPPQEDLDLQGVIETYPELPEMAVFKKVLDQRADYNALLWERKLREKNVSVQKANFYPSLEGSLQYVYAAASDRFALDQENDNIILGLTLEIPIFAGGSNIARVRRATADVDRVKTRIANANENIRVELENLHLQMSEARQRIEANRRAVQSARRSFEIAETRVDNGLSTQVELKDSRVALDLAQVEYLRSIFDYLSAYFEWELAVGEFSSAGF